jgi:hypothetical protein
MANYTSKRGFFESVERRKKRRRDPPDERIRPAAYGLSCADLDRLTAGRGASLGD